MTSNIDELGKKALELSTHDRALLIRKLLESLEDGDVVENGEEIPFSIYYAYEKEHDKLIIIAIAHQKRKPGYWKQRI